MRHTFLGVGVLLAALLPAVAGPCDTLPCLVEGTLHGAPCRIRVPSAWNGTLLVYLMGLKSPPNHPAAAPLAPIVVGGTDMEAALLAREQIEDLPAPGLRHRVERVRRGRCSCHVQHHMSI